MLRSKNHVLGQFLRFSGVGAIGTSGHYATLLILVEFARVNSVIASGTGFVVGALINYHLNKEYTFRSAVSHRTGLPKFMTIAFIGLVLNTMTMSIIAGKLHYLLAQIIATSMVLIWNFLGNKFWTFRGY